MNPRVKNELGHRYGRLLVIRYVESLDAKAAWLCLCDCGSEITVTGDGLRKGNHKSCGCFRRDHSRAKSTTHGQSNSGGLRRESRAYKSWQEMKARCGNPKHISYPNYGGRGLTFDPSWEVYDNFFADMGERPEGHSLDRVNNELGYSKGNCKWSTRLEQNQNRRLCHFIQYKGKLKVLSEWCRELKIDYHQAYRRIIQQQVNPTAYFESVTL